MTQRMLVLPAIFLCGVVAVMAASAWLDRRVREGVFYPRIEPEIIEAQKSTLKTLVDLEAQELGAAIQGLVTEAEKLAVIERDTDPLRFFDDRSGYFFTYRFDGMRINVPVNKALNGKNTLDASDPNGVRYIEALIKVARDGGGFVNYSFEKPGAGIQPKLSYACGIPGTDYLIGAGVYMDHVPAEIGTLRSEVEVMVRQFQFFLLGLSALMGAVTVVQVTTLGREACEAAEETAAAAQELRSQATTLKDATLELGRLIG